jgi:hypothetical protein
MSGKGRIFWEMLNNPAVTSAFGVLAIAGFIVITLVIVYPILLLPIGLIILVMLVVQSERKKSQAQFNFVVGNQNVSALKELANNLGREFDGPIVLRKDEVFVYNLPSVGLIEYRSGGATYSGSSRGVSVRVAKGISIRTGATRGTLTKNPEELTVIDQGAAIFTNQRVVFAGNKISREWLFSKLLDANLDGNGINAFISVSNRQKTSGLKWTDSSRITPGLALAVAFQYFLEGENGAKDRCLRLAKEMEDVLVNPDAVELESSDSSHLDHSLPLSGAPNALQPGPIWDVVGESFYSPNFDLLRAELGCEVGDRRDVLARLIAEPNNPYSKNGMAVAVEVHGKTVGHIPESRNSELFELINKRDGTATCQARVYFAPAEVGKTIKNSVELLISSEPSFIE